MTRTATFTGTILIVAGFVATAIAAEPESSDTSERFKARLAGIDRGLSPVKVTEQNGVIALEAVAADSAFVEETRAEDTPLAESIGLKMDEVIANTADAFVVQIVALETASAAPHEMHRNAGRGTRS